MLRRLAAAELQVLRPMHAVCAGSGVLHGHQHPGKNIRNEASTIIGYPFAENVKVTADIDGGNSSVMFTDKDSAWIENPGPGDRR